MRVHISDRFPAFNPISLRRENAREFFKLVGQYTKYSRKEQMNKQTVPGSGVMRVKAGDDWF